MNRRYKCVQPCHLNVQMTGRMYVNHPYLDVSEEHGCFLLECRKLLGYSQLLIVVGKDVIFLYVKQSFNPSFPGFCNSVVLFSLLQ